MTADLCFTFSIVVAIVAFTATGAALAVTPAELQSGYAAQAKKATPEFAGFSAARGEQLFTSTHGGEWSCSSCHGKPPVAQGKHAKTGKAIAPLAPSADAQRFTDAGKVDKWFRRNCNDVMGRECSAAEKGDIIAYLLRFGN
jgi:mono/diheme cytochrome c family protein